MERADNKAFKTLMGGYYLIQKPLSILVSVIF